MPSIMRSPPSAPTLGSSPGLLNVAPCALRLSAQVFARALEDGSGGKAEGLTLVRLFDGDQIVPDNRSPTPSGGADAAGFHPAAVHPGAPSSPGAT